MNQVLIEHGKHRDLFWDASTLELLDAAALEIIRARIDYGYICTPSTARLADMQADAAITDEQIAAMPGSFNVKAALEERRKLARGNLRRYEQDLTAFTAAQTLAQQSTTIGTHPRTGKSFSHAWVWLENNSDGEYEEVELETLRQAKIKDPHA